MSLKILVVGDPHFKVNNGKDTDLMVKKIIQIAQSENPDLIVNLGDTLDRHETIHVNPLKRAVYFMSELSKIATTVLIIGNHDRPNNSCFLTNDHPFNALKDWENLLVVDKVCKLRIKKFNLVFVPYVPPGRFQEALDSQGEEDHQPDLIFCHQEFRGAKLGPILSTEGDVWPEDNPYVISGHIHDYDQLQKNILYPGTPIQHGFSDTGNKAICMVYLEKNSCSLSPIVFDSDGDGEDGAGDSGVGKQKEDVKVFSSPTVRIEKILLGIAKKITLRLSPSEVDNLNMDKYADHEVKIVIKGSVSEINTLIKKEKLKKLSKVKIVFDTEKKESLLDTAITPDESFMEKLAKKCNQDTLLIFKEIFT